MRTILLVALAALLPLACTCGGDDDSLPTVPPLTPCLQDIIAVYAASDTVPSLKRIDAQYVDGQAWYWLVTDARTYDGTERIVDADCVTVCTLGGRRVPEPCMSGVRDEAWVTIYGEP